MNIDKQTLLTTTIIILMAISVISISVYASNVQSNKPEVILESNDESLVKMKLLHKNVNYNSASWDFSIKTSEDCTFFYIHLEDVKKVCNNFPDDVFFGDIICTNGILTEYIDDAIIKIQIIDFIKNGSVLIANSEYLQMKINIQREC